jgi:hypothetical protein
MSEWTSVRILYEVEKRLPSKADIDNYDAWQVTDLRSLYESAIRDTDCPDMYPLWSKDSLQIIMNIYETRFRPYVYTLKSASQIFTIADRGHLVIFGDIRDCTRDDFIPLLNQFRMHLRDYGVCVTRGLVAIE